MRRIFICLLIICTYSPLIQADSYDYNKIFDLARQLLTRKPVQEFLKGVLAEELKIDPAIAEQFNLKPTVLGDISEPQLMLLLKQNPDKFEELVTYLKDIPAVPTGSPEEVQARKMWRDKLKDQFKEPEALKKFQTMNNPLEPLVLETADKKPGYKNLKIYFTHERVVDGKSLPADNLKARWIDFIKQAKKQYVSNVFDFDLTDVADALIDAAKRGVDVTQGVDKGVADARPEVASLVKRLQDGGVKVHLVDSVGLNHQKTAARDWELAGQGAALFSSGNLTQSCIGPEGDLVNFSPPRSKYSVPNANHMITMDSDIAASLINHELTKTLRPPYQLRGRQYPLSGAYKIMGEPYKGIPNVKEPYIVISFTPSGGMGDISETLISRIIAGTEGPVDMIQFAFSSKAVENALLERAARDVAAGKKFEFRSVGDGPFAMQDWSRFLSMSGYELIDDGTTKTYKPIENSPWEKTLGKEGLTALQRNIRMPPEIYGTHQLTLKDGTKAEVTSKIHHKVLVAGRIANAGTSYNFSAAAQNNQEQFVVVADEGIAKEMRGAIDYLASKSKRSVTEEAERRNKFKKFEPKIAIKAIDEEVTKSHIGNTPVLKPKPAGTSQQPCVEYFSGVAESAAAAPRLQ